jgi:hypothetical protein
MANLKGIKAGEVVTCKYAVVESKLGYSYNPAGFLFWMLLSSGKALFFGGLTFRFKQ